MRVGGIIDISTKDIPNRSSMVIFTVGCNLNCEFCHNKYLLHPKVGKEIKIPSLMEQIKSNVLVGAVSITGGEPTLQEDLISLCKAIKEIGKFVNLDTNGTNPEVIKTLLRYVDRISLDLKGPLKEKILKKITRKEVDVNSINETIKIVNNHDEIEFEIRTTFVENLLVSRDIEKIILFLRKINFRGNFVLQQYQYSEGVGEEYKTKFQKPEHITLLNILKPYRNIDLPFNIYLRDEIVGYCIIDKLFEYLDEP